ncbi:Serine/Threonine protein kinase [Plesiocystis pacifica SIR-1]|uniref:non-specific serine/threonine protein kinase n=1 Tax=Plesiocystis pacifica SIR-1 TaxID=391625 RepID=A6G3G8_9BACT|nr:serine/threonine-protein kinase [Plesiocystis pacifica]EDM79575.1 Serine/Threonine protein kinase [Plesiocystis pacifica SIR-1]
MDALLGRVVVIKSLEHPEALAEARAASEARHPNVVGVHGFGEHEGRGYIVLEFCEGQTLDQWSLGRPWREVLARIIEVGDGLLHCHRRLLVHGDVKPANIIVTRGRAVLIDFGLAGRPDLAETFAGTPGYIAPELLQGRRSPSNDVFALACTAWACLFGTHPHAGSSASTLLIAATERELQRPARLPRGMPEALVRVLASALEPEQAKRPELAEWLAQLRQAAAPPRRPHVTRLPIALAVLFVVALPYAAHIAALTPGVAARVYRAPVDERPMHEVVSANILRIADAKDIPLTEIADKAGLDRREFFAVLEGEKEGDFDWLIAVARALGVPASQLVLET